MSDDRQEPPAGDDDDGHPRAASAGPTTAAAPSRATPTAGRRRHRSHRTVRGSSPTLAARPDRCRSTGSARHRPGPPADRTAPMPAGLVRAGRGAAAPTGWLPGGGTEWYTEEQARPAVVDADPAGRPGAAAGRR